MSIPIDSIGNGYLHLAAIHIYIAPMPKPTPSRIVLTPSLAYASGHDAGNAHMRKAGRTRWNDADFNVAAGVTNRLLLSLVENPEHRAFIAKDLGVVA